MSPSPAPPRLRGAGVPDALPRDIGSSERNVGTGVASMIGALLLLIGVPVLLVVFVGNPLPTTAPSREWLTASITPDLIINVLAVLIWIVWAHFVVCFLSEWRAIRAGRMPGNVLMGGGSQLLARRLVAGILMLSGGMAIASGLTTSATAADLPSAANPSQAVSAVVEGAESATAQAAAVQAAAEAGTAQAASTPKGGAKHYEVKPPAGRNHDTLWDIAERTLGDPLRYKEIYALNQDRMQGDGARLTDADLIRPGWQLLLPADASGPGVRAAAPAIATMAPQGTVIGDGTAVSDVAVRESGGADATTRVAAPTARGAESASAAEASSGSGTDLGEVVLGGGLVLAGVAAALGARRGLLGTPGEGEAALRLAGNTVRSDLLDRALRVLSESRHAQARPLPDVSVAYLSDDKVILHVVGRPEPPAHPWRVSEDGGSWSVTATDLEGLTASGPAPYPALVDIAESHGYDVLVDLEYASGLVSVGGSLDVAREVVSSTVVDLATHSWSDAVSITMVGFADDLSEIAPQRIARTADLDAALEEIESSLGAADALLRRLGVDGVMSGRAAGRHGELRPRVLVLSAAPTADQVHRISALSRDRRTAFAAICVGDASGARWRFAVDEAGEIDLGVLGVKGTSRRFTLAASEQVRTLVKDIAAESARRTVEVAQSAPAALVGDPVRRVARRTGPDAPARATRDAAVQVRLLGPIAVSVDGQVAEAEGVPDRAVSVELLVMAALHPQGLHDAVLRSSLWPRGVEDDVVASTLRDTQSWLGQDSTGQPRLSQDAEGLWRLSQEVHVDWDELQQATVPDGGTEASAYLRALELARGEAFSGTPAGRYSWLTFHRAARDARALVISMASRVAALTATRDPARAESALRQGLTLVPASETLWRELIKLHSSDEPDGPAGIVAEMRRTLPGHRYEPETEALVSHLLPTVSLDEMG